MAQWERYTISKIVEEIGDEKFVIPVIQRELVWEEDKMELLFDSILKGNSFGSIIVIEEETGREPLFESRRFTINGNKESSRKIKTIQKTQKFVIDGQQRLQSLYIGLKGDLKGKILYFDLFSNFNRDYNFEFQKEESYLSKEKEDCPISECLWYPVKELFERLKLVNDYEQVVDEIIANFNIQDKNKQIYIKNNIKSFSNNIISGDSIGVAIMKINGSLDLQVNRRKVLELFIRLNDGGTKLSPIDLIASKLKGFDYRMEGFLREFEDKFKDINLSYENLIKLIFLLQDNHKKELTDIEVNDAKFALDYKQRIENTLIVVMNFLNYVNLRDYYKAKNRSFIPLFFIAYHIFHQKNISDGQILKFFEKYETSCADFKPMKLWIYHSLLNGVFRSKGAGWIPYKTGIIKILEVIKQYKGQLFPYQQLIEVYEKHPIKLFTLSYSVENIDILDRSFVYYLMYYGNGSEYRQNDIDHIMPEHILKQKNYKDTDINNIKNFQLLDYETNRGVKNGKPFAEWVNNPDYVKDKNEYIKRHLIPKDETLWNEDKFLEFSKARGNLILDKIKDYLK